LQVFIRPVEKSSLVCRYSIVRPLALTNNNVVLVPSRRPARWVHPPRRATVITGRRQGARRGRNGGSSARLSSLSSAVSCVSFFYIINNNVVRWRRQEEIPKSREFRESFACNSENFYVAGVHHVSISAIFMDAITEYPICESFEPMRTIGSTSRAVYARLRQ